MHGVRVVKHPLHPYLDLWAVFTEGDITRGYPCSVHVLRALADQGPGGHVDYPKKSWQAGQGMTAHWLGFKPRSEARLRRRGLWQISHCGLTGGIQKTTIAKLLRSSIHNFRGLLEWVIFAPWVTQNALPCVYPRCGNKSSYSFNYLFPNFKNKKLVVSHQISLELSRSP